MSEFVAGAVILFVTAWATWLVGYAAGQALVGAASDNDAVWTVEGMAKWSYEVADAMLLARQEENDGRDEAGAAKAERRILPDLVVRQLPHGQRTNAQHPPTASVPSVRRTQRRTLDYDA